MGKRKRLTDFWEVAGGLDAVVREFGKVKLRGVSYSAPVWGKLSVALFGEDNIPNKHWLWVVWKGNRRQVRDKVNEAKGKMDSVGEENALPSSLEESPTNQAKWAIPEKDLIFDVGSLNECHETIRIDSDNKHNPEQSVSEQLTAQDPLKQSPLPDAIWDDEEASCYLSKKVEKMEKKDDDKKERKLISVPKKFSIHLNRKTWSSIKPKEGTRKLRQPWTHVIYRKFRKMNPCCVLAFKYQHVKNTQSRKRNSNYLCMKAVCTFPSCEAHYLFSMKDRPTKEDKEVLMTVQCFGNICHMKKHTRKRQASNMRRGRISKKIALGVSNTYYKLLSETPKEEINAGNMTQSLSRDILKAISCELRRSIHLHENVALEVLLTQKIMRECDNSYLHFPGYIQLYQVDPFCTHLYTETGLGILVAHLRKKGPVSLYLDATGTVVSKIPDQNKRVLYYAIVLAGQGRGTPPLPVAEMLSNDHSVPTIAHWLLRFLHAVSSYTTIKVKHVETDFSWALIQAVLLSFNKENIFLYLDRCFAICQGKTKWKTITTFTVLHLCAAHIIKAVAQILHKHAADKGHKEFLTFVFARMQNIQSLDEGVEIFRSLCVVLQHKKKVPEVIAKVQALQNLVLGMESEHEDEIITQSDGESSIIMGRSPFAKLFKDVSADIKATVEEEELAEENDYYCPNIIHALMPYMGIFPLWSGIMLGDLRRHASDLGPTLDECQEKITRQTNCHVEGWFGIVKNHILNQKKRMRPGTFIRTMSNSLRGRYIEHMERHMIATNLSKQITSDIAFAEESWDKKGKTSLTVSKSKYYSVPQKMPVPKKKKENKPKSKKTKTSKHRVLEERPQSSDGSEKRPEESSVGIPPPEKPEKSSSESGKDPEEAMGSAAVDEDEPEVEDESMQDGDKSNDGEEGQGHIREESEKERSTVTQPFSFQPEKPEKEVSTLWKRRPKEVVCAIISSHNNDQNILIRHSELWTLKPHEWLTGEVLEGLLHNHANQFDRQNSIYILHHYIAGVMLNGKKPAVQRQTLTAVDFNNYQAVIALVNKSNHWKLLFVCRRTSLVFLIDPMRTPNELNNSIHAAKRIRDYFSLRQLSTGKDEWTNIQWKGDQIPHPFQQDTDNCGVVAVKIALSLIEGFPKSPALTFNTSKKAMASARLKMASSLLLASIFDKKNSCAFCTQMKPPLKGPKNVLWICCGKCCRWYHIECLAWTKRKFMEAKHKKWLCCLCI